MRIFLLRHAENGGDPCACPERPAKGFLSRKGIRQAIALKNAIREIKIDYAFSSPYGRALQTAEAVLKGRDTPIKVLSFLKEWMPGENLAEFTDTELEKISKSVGERYAEETWKTELGEGTFDMYARICPPFLKELDAIGIHSRMGGFVIDKESRNLDIAVFAHGGSLCTLLSFLLDLRPFPIGRFSFRLTGMAALEYIACSDIYYPSLVLPAPGSNPFYS